MGAWLGPALAVIRLWAVLRVQVAWRETLGIAWGWLALGLAVLLAPALGAVPVTATGVMDGAWLGVVWLGVAEFALGTLLGTVAALAAHALIGATTLQAIALRTSPTTWTALVSTIAASLAFGLGLHHTSLLGLGAMFERWPIGRPDLWLDPSLWSIDHVGRAARELSVLGLALATPVVLVVAVVEWTAACMTAGLSALACGPELAGLGRIVLALVALGAAWSAYPESWGSAVAGVLARE